MLHGQTRYNMRSRFLEELPEGCLKWLTPRLAARSALSAAWESADDSDRGAWGQTAGRWTRQGMGDRGSQAPAFQRPALTGHSHDSGYTVGQSVRHGRFGEGVIMALEGSGSDARAQVNFRREGAKWLALSVAKLECL